MESQTIRKASGVLGVRVKDSGLDFFHFIYYFILFIISSYFLNLRLGFSMMLYVTVT